MCTCDNLPARQQSSFDVDHREVLGDGEPKEIKEGVVVRAEAQDVVARIRPLMRFAIAGCALPQRKHQRTEASRKATNPALVLMERLHTSAPTECQERRASRCNTLLRGCPFGWAKSHFGRDDREQPSMFVPATLLVLLSFAAANGCELFFP